MADTENVKIETYDTGTEIFCEGQPGKTMYVLVSGAVALMKNGKIHRIIDSPNDFFGELSLAASEPRFFTAMATRPSKLLCIDESNFARIIRTNGKFAFKIVKVLSKRIRELDAK
jgi:CRP-like cAMP-binding protein